MQISRSRCSFTHHPHTLPHKPFAANDTHGRTKSDTRPCPFHLSDTFQPDTGPWGDLLGFPSPRPVLRPFLFPFPFVALVCCPTETCDWTPSPSTNHSSQAREQRTLDHPLSLIQPPSVLKQSLVDEFIFFWVHTPFRPELIAAGRCPNSWRPRNPGLGPLCAERQQPSPPVEPVRTSRTTTSQGTTHQRSQSRPIAGADLTPRPSREASGLAA